LQPNTTTNPIFNLNPSDILNSNLKTNPNFTPKSEDLNMAVLGF